MFHGPVGHHDSMVKQLLFAESIPGRPRPVGRLHYTWMDGAMHPRAPATAGLAG